MFVNRYRFNDNTQQFLMFRRHRPYIDMHIDVSSEISLFTADELNNNKITIN